MKKITGSRWASLVASVLFCAAVWQAKRSYPVSGVEAEPELQSLRAKRITLIAATDSRRDEMRAKAAGVERRAWTPLMKLTLERTLGPRWHAVWQQPSEGQQSCTLTHDPVGMNEWTDVTQVLRRLEENAGLTVESVEIQVTGAPAGRRFSRIEASLRVPVSAMPSNPNSVPPTPAIKPANP